MPTDYLVSLDPAYKFPKDRLKTIQSSTCPLHTLDRFESWKDYYEYVKYFSLGLVSLGLETGDVVCIIGDNEPEWFWAEFATQAAGGITTGIFVDSIPSEVQYIASHSDARFAIVNDQEQTDKFLEIKDELPLLRKVIYWDPKGLKNYDDPILIGFPDVIKLGREYEKTHPR